MSSFFRLLTSNAAADFTQVDEKGDGRLQMASDTTGSITGVRTSVASGRFTSWQWEETGSRDNFPLASVSRDQGWNEIEDAAGNAPNNVPEKLKDAWHSDKRSREYVNATLDKLGLDNIYYARAFKSPEKSS